MLMYKVSLVKGLFLSMMLEEGKTSYVIRPPRGQERKTELTENERRRSAVMLLRQLWFSQLLFKAVMR